MAKNVKRKKTPCPYCHKPDVGLKCRRKLCRTLIKKQLDESTDFYSPYYGSPSSTLRSPTGGGRRVIRDSRNMS